MQEQTLVNQATADLDKQLFQQYLDTYYAKTKDTTGHIKYGTAGFRSHADNLPHVCLRVGIFTGLVAKLSAQNVLGIVVTASHNPQQDNGLKQSDFDGGMIREEFEGEVSKFIIEQDLNKAIENLKATLSKIEGYNESNTGMVFLGRDTRGSGKYLSGLMQQGIESVGGQVKDFGEVTTPIIHWLVRYFNLERDQHSLTRETSVEEIFACYHTFFIQRFNEFYANLPTPFTKRSDEHIILDCSNGVGGLHIPKFIENMSNLYNVTLLNKGELKYLNEDCGAEYVHKKQTYPREFVEELKKHSDLSKVRCLAFDGDADRIVYFLPKEGLKEIKLMDGDRIISLFAKFFQTIFTDIQNLFNEIKGDGNIAFNEDLSKWSIGMVQTPYANGSSTEFLRDQLKVQTQMSPNGVKNLHPRAHKFDVGIYCESNGHGTFVLRDDKNNTLRSFNLLGEELISANPDNEKVKKFVQLLKIAYNFSHTQNQIMGDAMTNFLCIEQALAYLNFSVEDWVALYEDRQCLNSTVVIRDRSKIQVNETQDVILSPVEIQESINKIMQENPGSRAFARPSGTEDIVRVYAEHQDRAMVDKLTKLVSEVVLSNKEIN